MSNNPTTPPRYEPRPLPIDAMPFDLGGGRTELIDEIARLRAERVGLIESAYREGFQDGFDHGNLPYKYPAFDEAWAQYQAAESARKESN